MTKIKGCYCRLATAELTEVFSTSLRSIDALEIVEFIIETDDSEIRIGQSVGTPAITGDTIEAIQKDLIHLIAPALVGKELVSAKQMYANFVEPLTAVSSAKAAADLALSNFEKEAQVATDVTVPIATLEQLPIILERRLAAGFSAFKVKLSDEALSMLISKVSLIRTVIGAGAVIRIDPNQAWSVEQAIIFARAAVPFNIDYLEQPVRASNREGLAEIKRNCDIPIMADESCFTLRDLRELERLNAVDLINVKILKSGGFTPAHELAIAAQEAGFKVSIGSMMESAASVYAAVVLAAEIAPESIHDLDAGWWLKESSLEYSRGRVRLKQ